MLGERHVIEVFTRYEAFGAWHGMAKGQLGSYIPLAGFSQRPGGDVRAAFRTS